LPVREFYIRNVPMFSVYCATQMIQCFLAKYKLVSNCIYPTLNFELPEAILPPIIPRSRCCTL